MSKASVRAVRRIRVVGDTVYADDSAYELAVNLLIDLMHHCDRYDLCYEDALAEAVVQYEKELAGFGTWEE